MIPVPLVVFHLVQTFGTAKSFVNLITDLKNCVSFNFTKGHVKIIFLSVIALSRSLFYSKLERALHKHQEQHS